ncbi:MAG TPA: M13 family metallopeptidase [Thermoanaerobaculia bacterium]|nr:M13 family metallopeptidase [Thermoanaerobaculia bacterium]
MSPSRIAWVVAGMIALFVGVPPFSAAQAAALKGIETGDLDRTADPCNDFYAFANGTWRAKNPIPKGEQRWSRRTAGRETNRRQLRELLQELAAKADRPRGGVEQQLGDYFASCMNGPAFKNEARARRAAICLESTEALLGEPLGRAYAERHFPPAAKAKVQEIVRNLLAVLKDDLGELQWMSETAQQQALAKVAAFEVLVGYPDAWTDTSALVIRRDAFWANVEAARRFSVETDRKRMGESTSRAVWQLPPSSPGAYIDIQLNMMGLPAGFLQEPAFDLAASDAVNYGAIGISLAHDLTHAIDALGRDFDSTGQPRNWWTKADFDAFQNVGQCTVDQYDGYEIEPGVHLDGKQVLGEALGDLAGVRLAYRALERSMQSHPVPEIDGFSPEQQFFIAWGQFRGAAESLELQRQMVKSDPHPTAKYRVIGPLSNAPEFQQAFGCKAGAALVRPPEKRCGIW